MIGFSDKAVRVDDLGDGARVSLVIASVLLTASNTAALIEDLEVHQHPAGLERLLSFVLKVAESNNIQLFITTQSLDLLRILLFIYPPNCKVFALRRDGKGNLGCRQFTLDEIGDLLESKVDVRRRALGAISSKFNDEITLSSPLLVHETGLSLLSNP
jgi:predicted ATPase